VDGRYRWLLGWILCLALGVPGTAEPAPVVCGIAVGYPPYQYADAQGRPTGLDADVARLVFQELGLPLRFDQKPWDEVYLGLVHKSGDVDVLCGAEVNEGRKALFEFSEPYYQRAVVVFVAQKSPYLSVKDLEGRIITGDRGGWIEALVDFRNIRVKATASKEESFQMLQEGKVEAVIAPLEVGNWISRQRGLAVRVLPERDPGSPVAFAVAKGNTDLANRISAALAKLKARGQIEAVIRRYR
jgi:ABC-type amino acid transport substrate-binding protein